MSTPPMITTPLTMRRWRACWVPVLWSSAPPMMAVTWFDTAQSGGTTIISNRQFLLNNGITYNGDVAIWGGSSMTNSAGVGPEFRLQANAWVGLEGTGTAEYKGKILIARWDNHATFGNRGYSAVFYATNGGTAIFSGEYVRLRAIFQFQASGNGLSVTF
jgi:hypothetical protein